MRIQVLAVCAALAALVVAAPAASAGTITRTSGGELVYSESDADPTANDFDVDFCNDDPCADVRVLVRDAGASITVAAGTGCSSQGTTVPPGTRVGCPLNGASRMTVVLGGGNDRLTTDVGGFPGTLPTALFAVGGPGNDSLTGGSGGDTLNGGDGSDSLSGGLGNDQLLLGGGNDTGSGGAGNDTLSGAAGDDVLDGGDGRDTINGEDGVDTVSYALRTAPVGVTLADDAPNDGGDADGAVDARDRVVAVENATGGSGGDALAGGGGPSRLDGGAGDDSLNGGAGTDVLLGSAGADTIEARDGDVDTLDCGVDTDTAFTDAVDSRANCELPAPGSSPPPPPSSPTALKQMAVTISFGFLPRRPRKTTSFTKITVRNVPSGSKLVARCVTAKGKRCGGKLRKAFTKRKARGTVRIKRLQKRKFRAGSRLEVVVTNPAFVTQVKIVSVRRNREPLISTRCVRPGSSKRVRCGG